MEKITKTEGLGGQIKRRYADFKVEEINQDEIISEITHFKDGYKRSETIEIPEKKENDKEYLLIEIEKMNLDLNQAIQKITRRLGISRKRVGYAGLKDKRGITSQWISIYQPDTKKLADTWIKGAQLKNPKWSKTGIEIGELKANKFEITIRDISKNKQEIEEILTEFEKEIRKGIPNYFGKQRFGGIRNITHKVGKYLVKKDFETATKIYLTETNEKEKEEIQNARNQLKKNWDYKEALKNFPKEQRYEISILNHLVNFPNDYVGALRKMPKEIRYLFVHSLQSHIFNEIIEKRVKENKFKEITGDKIENGQVMIMLPGFETKYNKGEAGEIEKEIMKKNKIKLSDFEIKEMAEISSKGTYKEMKLEVKNFEIIDIESDEFYENKMKVKIKFELAKGNYATTVLEELMKTDGVM